MAAGRPRYTVPFPFIVDLTPRQAYELEEDFAYLASLIQPSINIFDAVIDPRLTFADASAHKYPNLHTLLQNEEWSAGTMLHVGVFQPENVRINENGASNSMSGKGDITLFGITGGPAPTTNGWAWTTLSAPSGCTVIYRNLYLAPSDSCSDTNDAVQSGGTAIAYDSHFSQHFQNFNDDRQ